jgi:hypothetical protein
MKRRRQLEPSDLELNLLVPWTPRWHNFVTSIRPAFGRKERPLAGEVAIGFVPLRGLLGAWALEAVLLFAVITLPGKFASLHPTFPPPRPKSDVIYYSGEELPQTEDSGGAPTGHSGKSGGREAFHRTQVIKVAREQKLTEQVLDAPKLRLPASAVPVANLLAIQRDPGPPPSEGLRSSLKAAPLPNVAPVPPSPEIARENMRKNQTLTASVIPPAPIAPRDMPQAHFPEMRTEVVPPPVSAPPRDSSNTVRPTLPAPSVIAPPPSVSNETARVAGQLPVRPSIDVVPPPPQASEGQITGRSVPTLNASVVPPPPNVSGGTLASGRGLGHIGTGAGQTLAQGTIVAPPANAGGSTQKAAAIISSKPGPALGAPTSGERGALAMSPSGGNAPGIGGSGGGLGNATGPDSGSAKAGTGPGSANNGAGPGANPTAKIGTSSVPGAGGAGTGSRPGVPNTPGISVQGGTTTIITLPSFGSTPNDPTAAGHSTDTSSHRGPGITVVATSRSGGAFNFYGALKGDRVYTTYLDTTLGTVVLQFADPTSDNSAYSEELNAPEPIRKTLPPSTSHTRVIISCTIDREGNLKNLRAVDGRSSLLTVKLLPALEAWRFRPVLRGDKPIEVTAILGFNIDTR